MHFWKKDIARAGEDQESFDGSIYLPKQKEITEEILSFQEKLPIVIAVCIWMAFHDYTKKEIGEYVDKFYPNSPYAPKVSWKKMTSYEKIKGNPAVCQTTVPMAVSCFVNSNTFEDCIWKAVQFGWDTDT